MTWRTPCRAIGSAACLAHPVLHMVVFVAAVILLYLPTLSHPFVFDDYIYLVNNPVIKGFERFALLGNVPEFVRSQTTQLPDKDLAINFVLRPVTYLTFCINYALGGLDVRGYRLVNIIIHAANGLLLYFLIRKLLTGAPIVPLHRTVQRIAFFATLLFLVNPLQTESVTYIIQRFTSLATTCYLASLLCYLVGRTAETTARRRWGYWGSVGVLLIGTFVKEFLFTVPVMLLALEVLVLRTKGSEALKRIVPHMLCMPIIPGLIVLIMRGHNQGSTAMAGIINVVNFEEIPPWQYFISEMRALFSYARLLLLPYNQSIDHSYIRYSSLLNPEVIISILLIALLLWISWWLARRKGDTLAHCCAFFILWYFIAFSIDSSVVPLPDLFSEHRSYFPSIGLFCALIIHVERILAPHFTLSVQLEKKVIIALMAIVVMYGSLTVARNEVWNSLVNIWSDAVRKSPGNGRAWHNLGVSYQIESGDLLKSEQCFRQAIITIPPYRNSYFSLGKLLKETYRYEEALAVYRDGVIKFANEIEFVAEIGIIYYQLHKYAAAVNTLETVMRSDNGQGLEDVGKYLELARKRLAEQKLSVLNSAY